MTLLAPLGLLALLTLPVILILHMLRERRRRVVVPSLLLWQLMPRRQEAQRRRRLPLTLLLFLHLLAAALLALALARPQWSFGFFGGERHLAIIIDTSTSMAAPAGGFAGSRLDAARARARELIAGVGPRGSATVISASSSAHVLDAAGTDGADRLIAALDGLVAAGTGTDLRGALTLAEAALQGRPSARILVLTDGALPTAEDLVGRPAPVAVEWLPVGGPADNRAIVALAARPRPGNAPVQVYARAVNYGAAPLRTVLRLYGDDELLDTRPVDLQPNGEAELTWAVPRGISMLRAELDGADGLPADDSAAVSLAQTRPIRALLVSAQPAALERALRAVPGLELRIEDPVAYAGAAADLTIFDGYLPDRWPAGAVLVVRPPAGAGLLTVSPQAREPTPEAAALRPGPSPAAELFEGVSLSSVQFGPVRDVTPPDGFVIALSRGEQPLVLRGRAGASEIAIWTFDLGQGNLTTRLAFPLLVARTVRDLTPPPLPAAALVGETVSLEPDSRATEVELAAPDGRVEVVALTPGQPLSLAFDRPGVYTLAERAGNQTLYTGQFAVNAGAPVESNLAPRDLPAPPPRTPDAQGAGDEQRALWPWLAAFALAVMLLEWLYVHGRRRALAEG
ncbi:MAG: VWA domain-containing protein [Chloroflexi bacterium OHK40]